MGVVTRTMTILHGCLPDSNCAQRSRRYKLSSRNLVTSSQDIVCFLDVVAR